MWLQPPWCYVSAWRIVGFSRSERVRGQMASPDCYSVSPCAPKEPHGSSPSLHHRSLPVRRWTSRTPNVSTDGRWAASVSRAASDRLDFPPPRKECGAWNPENHWAFELPCPSSRHVEHYGNDRRTCSRRRRRFRCQVRYRGRLARMVDHPVDRVNRLGASGSASHPDTCGSLGVAGALEGGT